MNSGVLKRPALGQIATLGSLYDARRDTFIPLSLFNTAPPIETVSIVEKNSTDLTFSRTDSYKAKFDQLGITPELGASFLAGLIQVEGPGRYLTETRNSNLSVSSSMHYGVVRVEEELNIMANDIKQCLAFRAMETDVATHVVVGITWGARCIITAKAKIAAQAESSEVLRRLEEQLGWSSPSSVGHSSVVGFHEPDKQHETGDAVEMTIHGDILANDELLSTDIDAIHKFIGNVHWHINAANHGKGNPIAYTLMPLSVLSMCRIIELKTDTIIYQPSVECSEKFVQLFDDLRDAQRTLQDYSTLIQLHAHVTPPEHTIAIENQLGRAKAAESLLKSSYARLLTDVRSGKSDAKELWKLLETFQNGEASAEKSRSIAIYAKKIRFVDMIIRKGAQYVGHQGHSLESLLANEPYDDAFILYFDDYVRKHQVLLWKEHVALFLQLLHDRVPGQMIILVDCEATKTSLEKPYLTQIRGGRVLVEDVVEHRRVLADNCVMRYNEEVMDRQSTSKPLKRRAVKVPCPHPFCDRKLSCNWICGTCQSLVEYGYVDDRLYCDCGSCTYDQWEFKCKNPKHGSDWGRYDHAALLELLKGLQPFEELNILILGETGVGKSTWINAFINYLTYDTLEEALGAENLQWVIPCSFSTQLQDERDKQGSFVQKNIQIGSSSSENRSLRGQSATQLTSVYTMDIDSTRVRLIDTPGIGDTRGIDQDNKNMVDILRVLRTYHQLHGILILLKPNASRLNVMFRFCIKQLLTHLHRNAVNNIVFGFTNTRGSNYRPGDTFTPLKSLLSEYEEIEMGLFKHNVYCFDSESFRYLSARKVGVDMGHLEDNSRSWGYSVQECKRLVTHIQSLKPHQVRSTINLNETRDVIVRMTEPMALISQKIQTSIEIMNDQIENLNSKKLSRKELEQSLYVQRESLQSSPVDKPRTVCTHSSCVELRSDFEGRNETAIIYKTMCHKPCYLGEYVTRNEKGHSGLQKCAAMNWEGNCIICGHRWMDHMHIYYDYQPMTYKHRDANVDKDLMKTASDIELQQQAIDMRKTGIEEFKLELSHIREAAIQFGFFLKRHAITPYNDATLEYIDHLIDQENMKVQAGGEKKNLLNLEKYRAEHVEKVQTLTMAMERGNNEEVLDDRGVRQLIDSILGLPHFGKDLKRIIDTNEKAADAIFRERSQNISAGRHWREQAPTKSDQRAVRRKSTLPAIPGTFPKELPYNNSEPSQATRNAIATASEPSSIVSNLIRSVESITASSKEKVRGWVFSRFF